MDKEYKKQNPYILFDGYNVNFLKKLENDKFIFVQPLDYEAANFMNSFECGGQEAIWCIGDEEYWEFYTEDGAENGTKFILALSKNPNPPQDELKYLIELAINYSQAWLQTDEHDGYDDCIPSNEFPNFFGHNSEEFYEAVGKLIPLANYIDENGNCILPSSPKAIEGYAFGGCEELKSITIPNSVTMIGDHAFCYCTNLESIVIPNSLRYIGVNAFEACDNLKSIDIPNSVDYIAKGAFRNCSSLESITIPDSTDIGYHVFALCKNLKSIMIPDRLVNDVIKDLPDDCLINGKSKRSYIKNNFRRNNMRRRWLKSSATKGAEITYIVDSNFRYEQSGLSDRIFDQTFDDWLLFNDFDYSRNLEYAVEEAVEKDFEEMSPRGLAEYIKYIDEELDDKVLSIIGKYDRSYNKLHLICTLAPGVDPESIKTRLGDYIEGQLSDGWGEGFEQHEMTSTEVYAVYSEDEPWDVEYFTYWKDASDAAERKNDDIESQMEEDEESEYAEYDSYTVDISTYCSFWNRNFRFNEVIISRDKDGFDDYGYDNEGYDREGFNRSGKDRGGFDRTGRKPMRETGPVRFDLNKTGRVTISNPYENLHNSIRRRRR